MNDRVAAYRGLVDSIAIDLAGSRRARQVGAECDDLAQEGLINVWQTLQRGVTPSAEIIKDRMKTYMKWLGALKRQPVPYEALLPLDDFTETLAAG